MSDDSPLKIEQYRFVTSMQTYQADVARAALDRHLKWFGSFVAGGIALLSGKSRLDISTDLLNSLGTIVFAVVLVSGVVSVVQVLDCLRSWYSYRIAEKTILPDATDPSRFWWLRETSYVVLILATVVFFYWGSVRLLA